MPALAAFVLPHLCGLILLLAQGEVPALFSPLQGWPAYLLLGLLGLLALRAAACHQHRPSQHWGLVGLAMCGFATGWGHAGFKAAQQLNQQVPLSCHKQQHQGWFELQAMALKANKQQSWLVKNMDDVATPCLKTGALLQLRVDHALTKSAPQAGDQLLLNVQLKPLRSTLQLQGFDVHAHWFTLGLAGLGELKSLNSHQAESWPTPIEASERMRWRVANWLINTLQDHPEAPLMVALVIGDQGLIDPEDRIVFNRTGVAHLVAISGLHITLFAGVAGWLFAQGWRQSARLCLHCPAAKAGAMAGLAFAVLYALVAGWGIPAQRTVFMMVAMVLAQQKSARLHGWDVWVLALAATLLAHPWAPLDAGFWLSFVAVAALVASNHGRIRIHPSRPVWLADAVAAQWAVTVALLLPCAMLFYQQSIVSPLANALSIPWMSFVSTPLALIGSLFQVETLVRWSANSLAVQRLWLEPMSAQAWASTLMAAQPWWIYAVAGLGCVLMLAPPGLKCRRTGVLLACALAWPAPRPAPGDFWLTAMDVGQGTALAIQTRHHLLIYDSGPARTPRADSGLRVVLPWLHAQGYTRPDALWVSHQDTDHAGGAPFLLRHAAPKKLVASMAAEHPLMLQATQNGVPTAPCHTHAPWQWDGVVFTPLNNAPNTHAHKAVLSTNNQSCVLKISNGTHSVLLVGDIEQVAELQLLARHGANALKADMLLVPHHGSRTSSSWPFLAAVRPNWGLIQSGWNNPYGHPHPAVSSRLDQLGIHALNTAQFGALKFEFGHDTPEVTWVAARQVRKRLWHLHESGAH
ncbi:DNA internalization-related competence protein ComEC/Rec2 [Limnobacter sp.]|uniref:DNA internalization-related competence protein ComEC/Rec2 n=1 Tax=Limnobacter sp. TaxID=2003368 RepID=UPI0035111035